MIGTTVASIATSNIYELWRPTIERSFVVDPSSSPLQYNHDSSIALFQGLWFVVWNANENSAEGRAGQYNMVSTSKDLRHWSPPRKVFSDSQSAVNPVPCDPVSCIQWQPNLFTMRNGSLGCVWSGSNGRDGHVDGSQMVTYLSVLDRVGGRWTNHAIRFGVNRSATPIVDGTQWLLFASQNPTILSNGAILAPVVMTDAANVMPPDAPPGCHRCPRRRSSVLISYDDGRRS